MRLSRDASDAHAWRKTLSDGALTAEILARYFPLQLSADAFERGSSRRNKESNWEHVQRFLRTRGGERAVINPTDLSSLMEHSSGSEAANAAAERMLLVVYRLLFKVN
jgi:hypothetical protein